MMLVKENYDLNKCKKNLKKLHDFSKMKIRSKEYFTLTWEINQN